MLIYSTGYGRIYDTLARVWECSAREHNPAVEVTYEPSRPPARTMQRAGNNHVGGNTHKLDLWVQAAHRCIDAGRRCVLMDADTFVLGLLADAFGEFQGDIAYTTRHYRVPFNAGVVFVNPTQAARDFLVRWQSENARLFSHRALSSEAVRRFGGVNQAAFAALIRNPGACKLGTVPCAKWNAEQTSWSVFGSDTRVVHIKPPLRQRVLNPNDLGDSAGSTLDRIVATYRGYETRPVGVAA